MSWNDGHENFWKEPVKKIDWREHFNKIQFMKELKIKPLANRVIVEPAAAEEKTSGGIILPDSAKEKQYGGIVLATGDGQAGKGMTVKVGDKVIYGKHTGAPLSFEGRDYLIMTEEEIFAIV